MNNAGTARSKFLNVMFVDIVNYTKMTTGMSRERFDALHEAFDGIALPVFEKYGGDVIKKIGDAFLVVFESATDSLLCGVELQKQFEEYNAKYKPSKPLRIKVAVAGGDVIIRQGDVYGDAVNLASRIKDVGFPGEVFFSEAVFLAMNKNEIPFVYVGAKRFKGFKHPVKVFRIGGMVLDKIKREIGRKAFMKRVFWYFVLVLLIIVLLIGFWDKLPFN